MISSISSVAATHILSFTITTRQYGASQKTFVLSAVLVKTTSRSSPNATLSDRVGVGVGSWVDGGQPPGGGSVHPLVLWGPQQCGPL